ncbi:hypothetical protein D3C86_675190 [compost metagenome]
MQSLKRLGSMVLVFCLSMVLVACGQMNTSAPQWQVKVGQEADTSALDFTADEAAKAVELNRSGELDTFEIADFEAALGVSAVTVAPVQADSILDAGAGFFSPQRKTRMGYIRTLQDGSYLLVLKGETTVALQGKDGKRDARVAKFLNRKVIVRGILDDKGFLVEHIMAIPSFKYVTDLFTTGRIAGAVYSKETRQSLQGALITLTQSSTGYLFRTQTNTRGTFQFRGLEPGEYKVQVGIGGFQPVVLESIGVQRGKKTTLYLPVAPR